MSSRRDAADSHVVLYRGSFISSVARGGRPLTTGGAKHIRKNFSLCFRVLPTRVPPLFVDSLCLTVTRCRRPRFGQTTCSLRGRLRFLIRISAYAIHGSSVSVKRGGVCSVFMVLQARASCDHLLSKTSKIESPAKISGSQHNTPSWFYEGKRR